MKVKQINEQEVNSLLKHCPKQVQEYVKALKNLIEIKDHTNKKALDKIKQLSIQRVVLQSEQLVDQKRYCNDCGDYVGKGCDNKDCKDFKAN